MAAKSKSFSDMVSDGIDYLSKNTSITYFGEGSIARALIEATALEVSRLQNYITSLYNNSFLSSATGIYLDLFGEMLGIPRLTSVSATALSADGNVRFYVTSGTLGSRLPHPTNRQKGLVPIGTKVYDTTSYLEFTVTESTEFPVNSKSAYVTVIAASAGASFNVGVNQLVNHNLSLSDVYVTNDLAINTGGDVESDADYKYRLTKAMTTRFGSNKSAIQVAALSRPGVVDSRIVEFARGAGTFDVLLIPRGNKLSEDLRQDTLRAINQATAFGIYPVVREPVYVGFAVTIKIIPNDNAVTSIDILKQNAQSAVLSYLSTVPLGGEIVINQIRSTVLASSRDIKDIQILELCVDGKPRTLRNIILKEDELVIPDDSLPDPIKII